MGFEKGFYMKNRTYELYYCTGEVHPEDSNAMRGINIRSGNLFLYEKDLSNFSFLSDHEMPQILQNFRENITLFEHYKEGIHRL